MMEDNIREIFRHIAGIPWVYADIEAVCYQGPTAGSEFIVYDSDKLYVKSFMPGIIAYPLLPQAELMFMMKPTQYICII